MKRSAGVYAGDPSSLSCLSLVLQLLLLPLLAQLCEASPLSDLQIRFPPDGGAREKRQIQTGFSRQVPDLSDIKQGCEIQGYETREREICEEIVERICLVSHSHNSQSSLANCPQAH